MMWKIEIKKRDNTEGENLKKDILDLVGTNPDLSGPGERVNIERCEVIQVYYLFGQTHVGVQYIEPLQSEIQRIAEELLADRVWETYNIVKSSELKVQGNNSLIPKYEVEVAYNPGVMDPVSASTLKGIRDLGIKGVQEVKRAKKYLIYGSLSQEELELVCNKLLLNPTIQHRVQSLEFRVKSPELRVPVFDKPNYIDILNAPMEELLDISKNYGLSLNSEEFKKIQLHFRSLGRNPTDIELETIAQTWSEHCVHKTFKSKIKFNGKIIEPLFTTLIRATKELSRDFCVSVFKDNAGIIKFTDEHNICFKVETHNHPSAIEPYGGAGTGTGGVIRDILGTGLGAKPILNTDVFCFGPPDYPANKLPKGTLHPKRVMKGVIAGVRDYGNKMGIPTSNGAVVFDERYVGNPVVYCGTVGLMPCDKCEKQIVPGDLIVLLGGRTGRDGIHGVTFASRELTEVSETVSSQAVQIGNPITEKKLTDVLLKLRDAGLYRAITDCGGGGLSSAVGELPRPYGAEVDLDLVPLKYEGLSYLEIWISEAQERMIIFVPQKSREKLLKLCADEDVEATIIGKIRNDKKLLLKYNGTIVGNLDMEFLHEGVPLSIKTAKWNLPNPESRIPNPEPRDLTPYLLKILSSLNVCSKEWVVRQYDHEVQGGSVIKPLHGDAAVTKPLLDSNRGVVVGCGINPKYGEIDPYWMAAGAVDEAIRNIVAVGANPKHVALLDNFSWGNPNKPEILGQLVRAVEGCYFASKTYKAPFISGKDSLNNEYRIGNKTISIPSTLLISAIGIIEDVNKAISMDLKAPDNSIYLLGLTFDELGGSHYYELHGWSSNKVPKIKPQIKMLKKLHQAMQIGLIRACHDCSEGGIGVTCSEMCFSGNLGMQIRLDKVKSGKLITQDDTILFSESNTRFVVEIAKEQEAEFEKLMSGCDFSKIGITTPQDSSKKSPELLIFGLNGKQIVKAKTAELKEAWQSTLAYSQRSTVNSQQSTAKTNSQLTTHNPQLATRVLILRTAGTNCDMETKFAFELVGSKVDSVHINQLISRKKSLQDYDILVLPGGFTYGDDISAGKILANELKFGLGEELEKFIDSKKLILGICNGFQILAKLGLLPGGKLGEQLVTLTNNTSGIFQCEWVQLEAPNTKCVFTRGIEELELPIAHAEGRFVASRPVISELEQNNQIALRYKDYNPNGSMSEIAGICDPSGRIFGLMPHPERFVFKTQHPQWTRDKIEPLGLLIFKNAVEYVSNKKTSNL